MRKKSGSLSQRPDHLLERENVAQQLSDRVLAAHEHARHTWKLIVVSDDGLCTGEAVLWWIFWGLGTNGRPFAIR